MKMNFCTLFDSNYLDKGLAMYYSLERQTSDFMLYIFAFDRKSFDILEKLNLKKACIISEEKLLFPRLEKLKQVRSRAEYCWTCTPLIIEYVLEHYPVDNCTYIDADMFFYADPSPLFGEMKQAGGSVSIIGHRFIKHIEYQQSEKMHGKYCVEFNTFYNDKYGRKVLEWWKERCLEICSSTGENGTFGDQKYLDNWKIQFERVYEIQHPGAGVAPWNITRYESAGASENDIYIREKKSGQESRLIFYHFHNLKFCGKNTVKLGIYNRPGKVDDKLVHEIYKVYFDALRAAQEKMNEEYGMNFPIEFSEASKTHRISLKDNRYTWADTVIAILSILRDMKSRKKDLCNWEEI